MLVWRWRQSRRHGPLLPVNRQRPADFIFPMAATVIPPTPEFRAPPISLYPFDISDQIFRLPYPVNFAF